MLTDIYYYNHYKPYIFGEDNTDTLFRREKISERRQNIALAAESDEAPSFFLNKSLNGKVLRYLRSTAKTVVDVKYYANLISIDMRMFSRNVPIYGLSPFKQNLLNNLETFTACYNRAVTHLSAQTHSQGLRDFSESLEYIVEDSIDSLSSFGFVQDDDGSLFFDTEYYNDSLKSELFAAIKSTSDIFAEIYELSSDILEVPITAHMAFKGFDYYYNYRLSYKLDDTFKIIESGMLLDKAL